MCDQVSDEDRCGAAHRTSYMLPVRVSREDKRKGKQREARCCIQTRLTLEDNACLRQIAIIVNTEVNSSSELG